MSLAFILQALTTGNGSHQGLEDLAELKGEVLPSSLPHSLLSSSLLADRSSVSDIYPDGHQRLVAALTTPNHSPSCVDSTFSMFLQTRHLFSMQTT